MTSDEGPEYMMPSVARHVSRIKDVQRSVADYSHSPYLGCCECRGVLSN